MKWVYSFSTVTSVLQCDEVRSMKALNKGWIGREINGLELLVEELNKSECYEPCRLRFGSSESAKFYTGS